MECQCSFNPLEYYRFFCNYNFVVVACYKLQSFIRGCIRPLVIDHIKTYVVIEFLSSGMTVFYSMIYDICTFLGVLYQTQGGPTGDLRSNPKSPMLRSSSGLGHRPFKPVTGVRVSYGAYPLFQKGAFCEFYYRRS